MKKIAICIITQRELIKPIQHICDDASLPLPACPVIYPINSYLAATNTNGDELKILLLYKSDLGKRCDDNIATFRAEFNSLCANSYTHVEIKPLEIPADLHMETISKVFSKIAKEIDTGTTIVADITYGPKDIPILLFAMLSFANKQLECTIEHILYRRVYFRQETPSDAVLCDYAPLLYLSAVLQTLECSTPEKARLMLDALLDI